MQEFNRLNVGLGAALALAQAGVRVAQAEGKSPQALSRRPRPPRARYAHMSEEQRAWNEAVDQKKGG